MSKSIIQDKKICYVCETTRNLHEHHTMFGKNRKKAEKDGLKVYLCYEHHEGTNGVHGKNGHDLDLRLKKISQEIWQRKYNKSVEEFIKRYGKSYL
jgi:hypothetical protein